MKAITLWQPWASLMVTRWPYGRFCKRFETRSRPWSYQGWVAIHSAAKITRKMAMTACDGAFGEALGHMSYQTVFETLPAGKVVGVGFLERCMRAEEAFTHAAMNPQERVFGDYSAGRYAYFFSKMLPIQPVPAKGKQGIWDWTPTEEATHLIAVATL